jgi:hypothetical protein
MVKNLLWAALFIIVIIYALSKCNQGDVTIYQDGYKNTETYKAVAPIIDYKSDSIDTAKWRKSKYGKIQKKHPAWTEAECTSVFKHEYWIGMSYDMLVYERGKPDHVNTSNYGKGNSYQCCWSDYNPSCFYMNEDYIITSYN